MMNTYDCIVLQRIVYSRVTCIAREKSYTYRRPTVRIRCSPQTVSLGRFLLNHHDGRSPRERGPSPMSEKAPLPESKPATAEATAPATTPPRRSPGHRGQ